MFESGSQDGEAEYNYKKLLRKREWLAKRREILTKRPQCQNCGRSDRTLAVHHRYYDYGILPWEYSDEAYKVVCSGKCHREADAERVKQEDDVAILRRHGWQGILGKKCLAANQRDLRKLADYKATFKAWLWREKILTANWNWILHPLWELWNILSSDFLADPSNYEPQLTLAL